MIDFFMVVEFKYMPFTVLAKAHKVLKKRGLWNFWAAARTGIPTGCAQGRPTAGAGSSSLMQPRPPKATTGLHIRLSPCCDTEARRRILPL